MSPPGRGPNEHASIRRRPTMPEPADNASATSPPRRRARRALTVLGSILLLAALALFIATRSPVLTRIVEPRLSAALGGPVQIGHASVGGLTRVILHDVRARAPGPTAEPGEVIAVDRLIARIDWRALMAGGLGVREVTFDRPIVRLSQDRADGTLNLGALSPRPRSGASITLPRVLLRDAVVEFGEHDKGGAHYAPLASIEVDGELRRSASSPNLYEVALVESAASAAARAPTNPQPITLAGEYDPVGVEGSLTLENVDLASWGPGAAPERVRDFWTQLGLQGQVARTRFLYSDARGVEARFEFQHVGLTLPIAADPQLDLDMAPGPRDTPQRFMRMSDATGTATLGAQGVRADITGLIEDLPYRVTVDAASVALDTAFTIHFTTTEPFSVAQRPQLLPFAPTIVRERFRSFSGPTAMLQADVAVTRAGPTAEGPSPVRISGELSFTDGEAAYASFPYTFREMTGLVRFDDEAIHIERISGVARSGATLEAKGVIAPPHDGAEVAITVRIANVPLDQEFSDALPSSRANLIDELFNRSAERRLRERGLLPDNFTLGGVGSLDINVRRPLGDDTEWAWDALLFLPRAGLLIERFPYPAIAENASVEVTSDYAEVSIPTVRGVGGGEGDLQARITLHSGGKSVFLPVLMVRALGIPVDERLACALPGGFDEPSSDDAAASRVLRALGVRGAVDAIARVLPRDDGEVGFEVALEFAGLTASPEGAGAALTEVAGRMQVSENAAIIDQFSARLGPTPLTLRGHLGYGEHAPATDLLLTATGLALDQPFDAVLAAFEPKAAGAIRAGIEAANAKGDLDLEARITRDAGDGSLAVRADLTRLGHLSFDAIGGRVNVDNASGGAAIVAADGARVARFDGFAADMRFDGSAPSRLALEGAFDLDALSDAPADDAEGASHAPSRSLTAAAALAWPSGVADALLARAAPERARRVRETLAAWGISVDADLAAVIRSSPGTVAVAEVAATPRTIHIARNGAEARLTGESGRVVYADQRLRFDALRLRGETIDAVLSGVVTITDTPSAELQVAGAVAPFDERARALLPESLRGPFERAGIVADRIEVAGGRVAISGETTAEATVRYAGLGFDVGGAAVADADGALEIRVDTADPRPFDATLRFDSARVQRVRLGGGNARLVLVDVDTLVVPSFEAEAYSGRVFGVAKLDGLANALGGSAGPAAPAYELDASLSGVSFDALRHDLRVGDEDDGAPLTDEGQGGLVDASIAVAGVVGRPNERVGRGAVRIWGGRVIRLPLAARLIELSNLQLPTGEQIDFANARFYIDGGIIRFEELGASSASVNLDAQGELRWPSLDLDLTVTSRAARRAPILSDLVEAFRNELIVSRVTGPLADPEITVETLPATRRLLDSIFGARNDRPDPARPAARPVAP